MSDNVMDWTPAEVAAALRACQSAPDGADMRRLSDEARRSVQVRARIVEEFVEACRDTHPVYSVFDRRDAVDAANAFLDRYPHIIEGWPTA